jgi:hypothetical protein
MRTCPLGEEEKNRLIETDGFPDWDWEPDSPDNGSPFEYKASDWGMFNGRVVALDYAAPLEPGCARRQKPLKLYSVIEGQRCSLGMASQL